MNFVWSFCLLLLVASYYAFLLWAQKPAPKSAVLSKKIPAKNGAAPPKKGKLASSSSEDDSSDEDGVRAKKPQKMVAEKQKNGATVQKKKVESSSDDSSSESEAEVLHRSNNGWIYKAWISCQHVNNFVVIMSHHTSLCWTQKPAVKATVPSKKTPTKNGNLSTPAKKGKAASSSSSSDSSEDDSSDEDEVATKKQTKEVKVQKGKEESSSDDSSSESEDEVFYMTIFMVEFIKMLNFMPVFIFILLLLVFFSWFTFFCLRNPQQKLLFLQKINLPKMVL